MYAKEDNRHQKDNRHVIWVYGLIGLDVMAVLAAAFIPILRWALSPAGSVAIILSIVLAHKIGAVRGKAWPLAVGIMVLLGMAHIPGFTPEFLRQSAAVAPLLK